MRMTGESWMNLAILAGGFVAAEVFPEYKYQIFIGVFGIFLARIVEEFQENQREMVRLLEVIADNQEDKNDAD